MKKKESVSGYITETGKVVSRYTREVDRSTKRTVRSIDNASEVDERLIGLLTENQLVSEEIGNIRKELPSVLSPEGTEERFQQIERMKTIKHLRKRKKEIEKDIGKIYSSLPKERQSATMKRFSYMLPFRK